MTPKQFRSLGVLLLILGVLGIAAGFFGLGPLILLVGLLFLPLGIVCIGVSRAWEAAEESQRLTRRLLREQGIDDTCQGDEEDDD